MKWNVICVYLFDFVEEIFVFFYEYGIGCLLIMVNNKLIGILIKIDVFWIFVSLIGAV